MVKEYCIENRLEIDAYSIIIYGLNLVLLFQNFLGTKINMKFTIAVALLLVLAAITHGKPVDDDPTAGNN